MKPVQVPAALTAFGAPPTNVIATVAYRDPGERVLRALGGLGLFWGSRALPFPAAGPHSLELDAVTRRLFCARDGKVLVVLDCRSGDVLAQAELTRVPDVIFFNRDRQHLHVAIGNPGLIEKFETETMRRLETVRPEPGVRTLGFDPIGNTVYALLPNTHRVAI
jgi:DNA-binding beta-propeller fold protein YncE